MAHDAARDKLIVALDFPDPEDAHAFTVRLGDAVTFYKIGLELAMSGGLDLARELADTGRKVFLDMKLLDIENTVERAVRTAARTGATFLTVHGQDGKTLRAAAAGKAGTHLKILAVTVLTNLDAADLVEQGIAGDPADVVVARARLAQLAGCEGVVASGQEAQAIRAAVGAGMVLVTPGIRTAGGAAGDQARVMTPQAAISAGADYLVVGRPITQASDPRRAAEQFVAAIGAALDGRAGRG